MRRVFADSLYWIALANPRDQWNARALKASGFLQAVEIVTTEEVLSELFLTHFRGQGRIMRDGAIRYAESIMNDLDITVIPQTHQTFLGGLALYKARPDKGYSLTDCISMEAMRQEGIAEVLTHDSHFTQEGFLILL
jgi:predicted nucleic acid-binding protein